MHPFSTLSYCVHLHVRPWAVGFCCVHPTSRRSCSCSRVERSINRIKEAAARGTAMRVAAAAKAAAAAADGAGGTVAASAATSETIQTAPGQLLLSQKLSRIHRLHTS